jgi:hypothetical protein
MKNHQDFGEFPIRQRRWRGSIRQAAIMVRRHRHALFPFLVGLAFTTSSRADTLVPSGPVSGVWTLANSPYIVQGSITVPPANALTIQAGVIVKISPPSPEFVYLEVQGVLRAIGEPVQRITFTSTTPGDWAGIRMRNNGPPESILSYVDIMFAGTALDIDAEVGSPQVTLAHSDLHMNWSGVRIISRDVYDISTNVAILSNRICSNRVNGIYLAAHYQVCGESINAAVIDANEIFANTESGILLVAARDGPTGCPVGEPESIIAARIGRNIVHHNGAGITSRLGIGDGMSRFTPAVVNNLIFNNAGHGVHLEGSRTFNASVVNNTIVNNALNGIQHGAAISGLRIQNNIVAGNHQGIFANTPHSPGLGRVASNDVYANTNGNWINYPASFGLETRTNRNGTPADAEMNLSVDPQFAGTTNFHLQPGSPCVNAASTTNAPGTDFEGERRGTYIDIGFDEVLIRPMLSASAILPDGMFIACVTGEAGIKIALDRTSNLVDWVHFATVSNATGSVCFTNTDTIRPIREFYRGRELP